MSNIKLYYITIATLPHPILENLQKKITKNNERIEVLGLDENRQIGWEDKGNFGIKLKEVKNFVFNDKLKDEDIVLMTDGFDVIYAGNKDTLIKRYYEFNSPIVFGCETQCHPDKNMAQYYQNKDKEFPYLNSGMYIGKVWALKKCLKNYVYEDKHDDQLYWTHTYFNNPDLIALDYDNKLFLNSEGIEWDKLTWNMDTEYLTYKDKNPLFLHINGPDKTIIRKFL
jgi:hypothetical protein